MPEIPEDFGERLREAAEEMLSWEEAQVVSHIDTDGLTSASIADRALERAGVEHDVKFFKQLDGEAVRSLEDRPTVFTDFGSADVETMGEHLSTAVVLDHHEPEAEEAPGVIHVNPHLFGVDGSSELCGATTTYLVARELGDNADLASTAAVGAVGDIQARGGLEGLNRFVLEEGEEAGVVEERKDLSLFGKQTRPLHKMLQYSGDPFIPGITGNESGAVSLLESAGVEMKRGEEWRRWIDLDDEERQKVVSALMTALLQRGRNRAAERLVGPTYVLLDEEPGTELREASEFSTLLNATARYGHPETGLAVCKGDRDGAMQEAAGLLRNHRKNLVKGLDLVKEKGVTRLDNVQYFHAEDQILDTVVGIVAGMSTNLDCVDRSMPIVAFAYRDDADDEVKVSSRGTASLRRRGLNLAETMREASETVGGAGGGHDVAAGATVPKGREEEFLQVVDQMTAEQTG